MDLPDLSETWWSECLGCSDEKIGKSWRANLIITLEKIQTKSIETCRDGCAIFFVSS